jgi:hypothetical protein
MKRLLMLLVISFAAITNFGLPPSASATCDLTLRIDYYDCNTGAWRGVTEYYCDRESFVGCQTQCRKFYRTFCMCE